MEPKRVISVSQVNTYLGCSLKYRFQYVDKIPRPWRVAAMAFGTSVHAAVEWFHRERLAGRSVEMAEVLKVFDADWYAQNVEPLVFSERESKDSIAEKGRAMLQLYVESTNGIKPVAVEQFFELDLVDPETGEVLDVRLRGVVDLVEEGDTLIDLKTAGRTLEQGGATLCGRQAKRCGRFRAVASRITSASCGRGWRWPQRASQESGSSWLALTGSYVPSSATVGCPSCPTCSRC